MKFEDSSEALKFPGQAGLMFFDIMAARIGPRYQLMVCPIWLRALTYKLRMARCHGTSKVVARVSSAAIAPSVLRGAIKDGSKSSSVAARSRRRRNSSVRAIIRALGRVPRRRRKTGHSDSRDCNALVA